MKEPRCVQYANSRKIAPSPTDAQLNKPRSAVSSASSASAPSPTLIAPTTAKIQNARRMAFFALMTSAEFAGRTPGAVAQLTADEASSLGPTAWLGAVHTWGCWAGAMAPRVGQMSQVLLPSGIAQPQRLQTAIWLISTGRARTSMTVLQQKTRRQTTGGSALRGLAADLLERVRVEHRPELFDLPPVSGVDNNHLLGLDILAFGTSIDIDERDHVIIVGENRMRLL